MEISLKVCGMRDSHNIKEVESIEPQYLGFIFYPKSSRFIGLDFDKNELKTIDSNIKKVGVFVNAVPSELIEFGGIYGFDYLQLHGDESPEVCKEVKEAGFKVIKAFGVGEAFDFSVLEAYKPYVDFFLFDTKGKSYGGNGVRFDWEILNQYDNEIPLFLSGGIDLESVNDLGKLKQLNIHAIDVNSKFEIAPAFKDANLLRKLKEELKNV